MATRPKTTKLSTDLTKPQPTAAGDAPADTWDPTERAHSARPDKAAAAAAGHQSVNAIVPGVPLPSTAPTGTRTETYSATGPDGKVVEITHNYDTGETTTTPVAPGV